jgi:quinoprotein glucose dehydrogenase
MNKHLLAKITLLGAAHLLTLNSTFADIPLTPSQFAKAKTENFDKKVILSNLNKPHALLWGPDNQIWLTERATGKILRVNPESGSVKTVFQVPEIVNDADGQNGLLGFAFHPDFKNNPISMFQVHLKIRNLQIRNYRIKLLSVDIPITRQQIVLKSL